VKWQNISEILWLERKRNETMMGTTVKKTWSPEEVMKIIKKGCDK
jgi:hypothetical protein